jgi:hypothetical protein
MRVPKAADMSGFAHSVGTHVQSNLVWSGEALASPLKIETPGVCSVPETRAICTSARTDLQC